jgi:hypothetical protein
MGFSAVLNLMSNKDYRFVAKNSSNAVIEDMTANTNIYSA